MAYRRDGRIEPGQPLKTAISATAWNRAQDAADVVLGLRPGLAVPMSEGRFHLLGKTSATWAKASSQNITIWAGPPGSEAATSSVVIAYNRFAEVAANRFVLLSRVGEHWYLSAAECP
jgi:hypothetical protein